ncbi:hypothetical protein EV178_003158 [Coemansia sp. RSA 1646]|nr:hypothetical protein EV178_003158 [Coemansia sp. RSA 1646]KAJ2214463.1 hypothetical protein EV179_003006 [Coemansia sp. RSA 487]
MVAWVLETLFGGSYEWQAEIKNDYNIDVEEIHHNIKSIKMFGWERMYVDPVLKKHWNKADNTRVFPWYAPVVRFIWFLLKIIDLVSEQLSVYIAIHIFTTVGADSAPAISNADIFQLETLMNDLLHKAKELCINFKVLRRVVGCNYILEKFLKGDFVDTLPQYSLELGEQKKDACSSEPSMTLDNCDFALKKNETVLKNISFNAKNGELVAVVGKTGSGKSSLLLSICGEVEMTKGSGAVFGSVALMEQTPWIINDTIRENILFGREYDEYHYKCVVEACALTDDIKTWTNGDKTVIGERGINISGGQRARLALARTVYSKADIYVLDDPLSAVDAHVKRHILDNVIMDSGLLSGKIRVVSVNAKSLLPYFDKVIHEWNKWDNMKQYMDIDRDDNSVENTVEPPSSWPSAGKIEFRSFSMKYRSDLEYALKDINLTINPGEKVGIVGRTGAGKTSLSRAVFRLIKSNSCEGSILIDGADIFSINPDILRPKMGTIPQESTMFKGSFKQNLDPLLEYSIEDMWAALVKCNITEYVEPKHDRSDGSSGNSDYYYNEDNEQLKEEIAEWNLEWEKADWRKRVFLSLFVSKPRLEKAINRKVKHGLDKNIGSHSRFSSGQQQLFSLCRLLMRKRKIIVLDEATADVDLETDQEMQKLFRSEFKDCTVLTIAHRLETIMGCDRIIVMDKGTVAEFGPPKDLIEQGGYFAELVKANDF